MLGSHFDRAAQDHAMSRGWMPHKPETWPHRYATLNRDVVMLHLRDSKEVEIPVPAGSTVKLVMVSRFGDVGVTEDLTAENGYGVRLPLCDLCDWRDEPLEPLKRQDEPIHSPVTVTILDTLTGETRTDSEWSPWYWAYGNGSCDCNRGALFGNEEGCGERRYYIVAVEGDESGYELAEDYNHLYPPIPPKCATH